MYDVIIIGGGPAGISASLYTARAGLNTLIVAKGWGSLEKAHDIQNYYGTEGGMSGLELLENGRKQADSLGVRFIDDEVVGLNGFDGIKVQGLKDSYEGKALIIAMGSPRKKLSLLNLAEFEGKGISYCAACDGFFYRDSKIAVFGYNEYMIHEVREIKELSGDVTVFTNGRNLEIAGEDESVLDGIGINRKEIKGFYGSDFMEGIEFKDGLREEFQGAFIAYGSASGMEMALKTGLLTENGAIVTDDRQCTNLPNIFAAGDCTGGFKQVSVAVGEGALAARSAIEFIRAS